MDPVLLYGAASFAAVFLRQKRRKKKKEAMGRRVGTAIRVRIWRSIDSVYHEIGDDLFRWAYRMTYPTFLELHRLLEPEILSIHKEYQEDRGLRRKERKRGEQKNRREDMETICFQRSYINVDSFGHCSKVFFWW
jgi:hypothetical protein